MHLDALLNSRFYSYIYRPSDFRGSNTDMRLMAQKNNWPSYEDLLGKIVFVLGATSEKLNEYQTECGDDALCFTIAGSFEPEFSEAQRILNLKTEKDYNYPEKFIFYNYKESQGNRSTWESAPNQGTAPLWTSAKGCFSRDWGLN